VNVGPSLVNDTLSVKR